MLAAVFLFLFATVRCKELATEGRAFLNDVDFDKLVEQHVDAKTAALLQSQCSTTRSCAQSVYHCTNAVRTDPWAFTRYYKCNWRSWINSVSRPRRGQLRGDRRLHRAAQFHSQNMARRQRMSHTGSDGSNAGQRMSRQGYQWSTYGENVAYGHRSALDVVMGWMCSSGHRKNMMNCKYADFGVGVATARNGQRYYTQVFGCQRGRRCSCPRWTESNTHLWDTVANTTEVPDEQDGGKGVL